MTPKTTNLRMDCNFYEAQQNPEHRLPTWSTCSRSSLAVNLVAQKRLKNFMKLHRTCYEMNCGRLVLHIFEEGL